MNSIFTSFAMSSVQKIFKMKITKIREELKNKKIESFLISNLNNIWYVTGFSASFAKLFITKNEVILVSDSRYSVSAKQLCDDLEIQYKEIHSDKNFWNTFCAHYEIKKLGIEAEHITLSAFNNIQKQFTNIDFIETKNIVENMRIKKSKEEIEILRQCAEIGDVCLKKVVESFAEGVTEKELAWIFEKSAREFFGASGLSFDTIVAFAENSASPHHESSNKKLEINTPILIDCGVRYKNYCSDLTRCFWFGEKKGEEYENWKEVYEIVKNAQQLGIEKMKKGIKISESEKSARTYFASQHRDHKKYFGHSFGHGVGIDIHELPHVSAKNETEIYEAGMVVTAEPGLYFSDNSQKINFGIRIEDLLFISDETGEAEFLSGFKK